MALSRHALRSNTSHLLGGKNLPDCENTNSLMGKAGLGKARGLGTRGTLAVINQAPANVTQGKMALKNEPLKKPALRSGLRSQVNEIQKPKVQNAMKPSQEVPLEEKAAPSSPAPMDISANSQGEEAFSKKLLQVDDIDKDDADNPQLVSEYVKDIYEYMLSLEERLPVKAKYLDGTGLNGRMRGILVDWLVQVHLRFHLLPETLYLTVAIIDRFLQAQEVSKSKLQLVGVTAMLLASKYEEMYAPEVNDFVYITDNAYTKTDILRMEILMLKSLDFELGRPLPLHFLRRNSKAGEVDAKKHTMAKYLMELTIVDYDLVHQPPSLIAAAALCLSMRVLDDSEWSDTLEHYSTYSQQHLLPVMRRMAHLVHRAGSGKLTAIKTKYSSSKFLRISTASELNCAYIQELSSTDAH